MAGLASQWDARLAAIKRIAEEGPRLGQETENQENVQ
jgi:hypothetical protein